jgi:hypothetical protein
MVVIMSRSLVQVFTLAWLTLALGGCADSATAFEPIEAIDSTCAGVLCGWDNPEGRLLPSASWHEHQQALELADTPTRITRRVPGKPTVSCLSFTFLAEVEPDAQLELQLDFDDDGSIDTRALVPALRWRQTVLSLRTPAEYRSLRVNLERQGPGHVRIASLRVTSELSACADAAPTSQADGATCSIDQTCSSGHCVLGRCVRTGAQLGEEGQACSGSEDCRDGACAAGVCRACAKRGDCAAGATCSVAGQCASRSCTQGALPSAIPYPGEEGTCGDCASDSDCAVTGTFCVLGRCSDCRTDADCAAGKVCGYSEPLDATRRVCRNPLTSIVSRGGLCEVNADCASGLRCGASNGRPKRCGISCSVDAECGTTGVCAMPGATRAVQPPARLSLLPGWQRPVERIATCYPRGLQGNACDTQEQCAFGGGACCDGVCKNTLFDPESASCKAPSETHPLD